MNQNVQADIIFIDPRFPQKMPRGYRDAIITGLLNKLPNFQAFAMSPMLPDSGAWFKHGYGISYPEYLANRKFYLDYYKNANAERIHYLFQDVEYQVNLACSLFLADTYTLLPFYEKHKIPFCFMLYPGGAFGLENEGSDRMLQRIFESKYFKKVISTQPVTYRYLNAKKFCPSEKIAQFQEGVCLFDKDKILPKKYYKKDKDTFDLCFVAFKYSEKGVDKGYDLVIESARFLAKKYPDIHFHIVGDFTENEIDVSSIKDNIHFYGPRSYDWLIEFYSKMDIFLTPNRFSQLFKGNFDGFPLGLDSLYCGVAIITTDELKNNWLFEPDELIIVEPDFYEIIKKVVYYYNNSDELYALAHKGQAKITNYRDKETNITRFANILLEAKGND